MVLLQWSRLGTPRVGRHTGRGWHRATQADTGVALPQDEEAMERQAPPEAEETEKDVP